jgi:hypothetical protein
VFGERAAALGAAARYVARMHRSLAAFAILLASAAAAPHVVAEADATRSGAALAPTATQDLGGLHAAALAKARELASWADERKLYTGRNALHEIVLGFDPNDADARKALGFKKVKGEWQAPKTKREPVDECEAGVREEFAELRRAALAELAAQLDALFDPLPNTPANQSAKRAELAKLVVFDDATALRERLGEVWDATDAKWILVETRDARAARAAFAARVEELRAALPAPEETAHDEHTRAMEGLEFECALSARTMNATSTLDAAETTDLLLTALLTRDVFQAAFPNQGAPGYPTVLYALEPGERARFFEQHPLTPKAEIAYRTSVTSSWLQGRLVVGGPTPVLRKDVTAFQTAGYALTEKFEVWTDDGWAQQGLCSYLSSMVTGTRLSFWDIQNSDQYGKRKVDAKNWMERVPPSTRGWLLEAKALIDDGQTMAHFARALGSATIQMSWEDVVTSHAVAAYLFEARRDDLERILVRTKKEPIVPVVEDVLGMPLEELRARLVRWIDEVEPLPVVEDDDKKGGAGAKKPKSGEGEGDGGGEKKEG